MFWNFVSSLLEAPIVQNKLSRYPVIRVGTIKQMVVIDSKSIFDVNRISTHFDDLENP